MFVVLAKPVNQAIVIAPEKAEEFVNLKADPKVKSLIKERSEQLRLQRERFKSAGKTELFTVKTSIYRKGECYEHKRICY